MEFIILNWDENRIKGKENIKNFINNLPDESCFDIDKLTKKYMWKRKAKRLKGAIPTTLDFVFSEYQRTHNDSVFVIWNTEMPYLYRIANGFTIKKLPNEKFLKFSKAYNFLNKIKWYMQFDEAYKGWHLEIYKYKLHPKEPLNIVLAFHKFGEEFQSLEQELIEKLQNEDKGE